MELLLPARGNHVHPLRSFHLDLEVMTLVHGYRERCE